MKLSDVRGERTLDVIAEIIEPIANIAEDNIASDIFKRKKLPEGMTAKQFALQRINNSIPALIRNHKNDIVTVLSTIEGISQEEYSESLNLAKLTKDILDLLTDDEFMAFFTSAQSDSNNSSGYVSENIEEH